MVYQATSSLLGYKPHTSQEAEKLKYPESFKTFSISGHSQDQENLIRALQMRKRQLAPNYSIQDDGMGTRQDSVEAKGKKKTRFAGLMNRFILHKR